MGAGEEQDKVQAAKLYRQAAEQGDARAQCCLGYFYYRGVAVKQDRVLAAEWFGKSARQGYPRGQYWLGECLEHGYGLPRDRKAAIECYHQAAEGGSQEAVQALERLEKKRSRNPLKNLFRRGQDD